MISSLFSLHLARVFDSVPGMDLRTEQLIEQVLELIHKVDAGPDGELIAALETVVDRVQQTQTASLAAFVADGRHILDGHRSPVTWLRTHCSIAESLARFVPVVEAARAQGISVRGYVSCVLGCPYEGEVPAEQVAAVAAELFAMGCYEVSLGDTIGTGNAGATRHLFEVVGAQVPRDKLAGHFHDTYGQAVANIYASLLEGISVFDSSVAGLGGCPYAKGATGNVATEDVVYLLVGLGIDTGIDLDRLIAAGQRICDVLGRVNGSRVARAQLAKQG